MLGNFVYILKVFKKKKKKKKVKSSAGSTDFFFELQFVVEKKRFSIWRGMAHNYK